MDAPTPGSYAMTRREYATRSVGRGPRNVQKMIDWGIGIVICGFVLWLVSWAMGATKRLSGYRRH